LLKRRALLLIKQPFTDMGTLVGAFAFAGLFLFIVSWFRIIDVWNTHFFEVGPVYIFYNGFKIVFLFYFGWILYSVGRISLQLIEQKGVDFSLDSLDKLLLSFYVGGAVLHLLMFILGYLNFYYHTTAIIITVPVLFLSYPHMKAIILKGICQISRLKSENKMGDQTYDLIFLIIIAFFITLLILISKALFPTTDHDTLIHYNNYYNEVVHSHGIWPNGVWYHYYLSKGSGLMFLGILLTDNQGPHLVSFCFVMASALTLFSLVRKISNDITWPLMATILYLAAFVHTPGWADFQKQHVIMAVSIAVQVWMMIMYQTRPIETRNSWTSLWIIITVSLVVLTPTAFSILFLFLGYFLATSLRKKQFQQAKSFALLIGWAGTTLLLVMTVNYFTTGLFEITPFRIFWAVADQARLSQWVSPYLILYLKESSNPDLGIFRTTSDFGLTTWFISIFRLYTVRYLFPAQTLLSGLDGIRYIPNLGLLMLLSLMIGYALIRGFRPNYKYDVMTVLSPILAMIGVATVLIFINNQSLSVFRFFAFTIFFVVIVSVALWRLFLDIIVTLPLRSLFSYLVIGIAVTWAVLDLYYRYDSKVFESEIKFALGQTSFQEVYSNIEPELYPGTGVFWPSAAKAVEIIGYNTRLWSFHTSDGIGTIPGQHIVSEVSYAYNGNWPVMVFAEPEAAKAAFKKEEINYFLLDLNQPIFGALPYSPLFAPNNIEKYFEIVWRQEGERDQEVYLLTWRGEEAQAVPLTSEFLKRWEEALSVSVAHFGDTKVLYDQMKYYYDSHGGRSYPIPSDFTLPDVKDNQ